MRPHTFMFTHMSCSWRRLVDFVKRVDGVPNNQPLHELELRSHTRARKLFLTAEMYMCTDMVAMLTTVCAPSDVNSPSISVWRLSVNSGEAK